MPEEGSILMGEAILGSWHPGAMTTIWELSARQKVKPASPPLRKQYSSTPGD
jgi:hypothetical protein